MRDHGPLDGPGISQPEAAEMLHGKQKDLVDPYAPKPPESKEGETEEQLARRVARYWKAMDKRIAEREQPSEKGHALRPFITGQSDADLVSDARLKVIDLLKDEPVGPGGVVPPRRGIEVWYRLLKEHKYTHTARNGKIAHVFL